MRTSYGRSETGAVRGNNEDSILALDTPLGPLPNAYIVADGMGGHNAGEIASGNAIAFFRAFMEDYAGGPLYTQDLLAEAAKYANREVYGLSLRLPKAGGMGTTFTVCSIDDSNIYYAHVGDSRIYLLRESGLSPVTEDHSLVAELVRSGAISDAEAREHPQRNIMTRALGTDEELRVDAGVIPIAPGERALLCSDGLTGMMDDAEIWAMVGMGGGGREITDRLVQRAIEKGGFDNVSVIIVE